MKKILFPVLLMLFACSVLLCGCSEVLPESIPVTAETSENQIIISEVMSSNSVFIPAADGRCYDWVELHNLTDRTFDLSSCYITDDERSPKKFQLTGVVLEPGGYAVVYLSGLGGVDIDNRLHADFKLSSQGETIYLNDPSGLIMFKMMVPQLNENVSYGFPDGARGYTENDGVWFAAPTPGERNSENYSYDQSKLVYTSNGVIINEYMTGNSYSVYDADGDYPDWVELYNPTDSDADMSGYMLSDDIDAIGKWKFPEGTVIPAGGYLTVFCSGKDKVDDLGNLHTSFSLGSDDTDLVLGNNQGVAASHTRLIKLPENISGGLVEETGEWKVFARPTPGGANITTAFEPDDFPAPDINDGVLISETLAGSSSGGTYKTDYIEIYNATSGAVDLGGYTLSQSPGEVVFTFPQTTLNAGCYIVVWCDGIDISESGKTLHAAIKINLGGEQLYLADATGKIVDVFSTGKQIYGVSSGRVGSDVSRRKFFDKPTPGEENGGNAYDAYAPKPVFSSMGGYVESGTEVSISVPEGCTVRYTTDGILPDESSALYDPSTPLIISRTTVLKAVAYRDNCLSSELAAATYFVTEPHSIPVVSMSGFGLIDHENGILVEGAHKNYRKEWVRNVHIEYYDESGALGIEFDAAAEIFGQYSKTEDKKGVRLSFREKYGISEVVYPFFPDRVEGSNSFRSLLLRPSGQDQTKGMLRDEIVPEIIRGRVDVDYQEVRACALYVNGEYWGLYYIRERFDEDYLVNKYGYEKGKIDLIKSQIFEQAGTIDDYIAMQDFARLKDLTYSKNYEHMASLIDLESLCDFWIVETYFANTDTGNIRCYKAEGGKWRWMVYDFDWSMNRSTYKRDYIYNHCLEKTGHGSADFSNAIIRKMLQNAEFRDLFISRYCYHLNTTFEPDRCIEILDRMADVIRDEVPRNAERWPKPSVESWENNVEFLRDFFEEKPEMAKQQLRSNFGLSEAELEEYLEKNK
ncbi:MAG: hypothetical protein E7554_02330 [Ruminococcaceae bacterium]|nr:hypothetical protein [Oscillospiraceae bacterium]